jgi:hypothetical protein
MLRIPYPRTMNKKAVMSFVGDEDPTVFEVGHQEPASEVIACQGESHQEQASHAAPDGVHPPLGSTLAFMLGVSPRVASHVRVTLSG